MDCPVCKNAMIVLELGEVEIDYCPGCDGIWLDAGELEMLLGDGGKAKILISSFHKDMSSGEKTEKMPDMRQEDGEDYRGERKANVDDGQVRQRGMGCGLTRGN